MNRQALIFFFGTSEIWSLQRNSQAKLTAIALSCVCVVLYSDTISLRYPQLHHNDYLLSGFVFKSTRRAKEIILKGFFKRERSDSTANVLYWNFSYDNFGALISTRG